MGHDDFDDDLDDLTPASVLRFGQRNVLYLGFVVLLVPFGLALDGRRPPGTESLGGIAFAFMLCIAVSMGFFVLNASLVVAAAARRRHSAKAAIGCVLPVVFGIGAILARTLVL